MSQTDERPVTLSTYPFELLRFRRFGLLGPAVQMTLIAALYVATTLLLARGVRLTGKMMGYDPDVWILFVPITEEILFRGLILGALRLGAGARRRGLVTLLRPLASEERLLADGLPTHSSNAVYDADLRADHCDPCAENPNDLARRHPALFEQFGGPAHQVARGTAALRRRSERALTDQPQRARSLRKAIRSARSCGFSTW